MRELATLRRDFPDVARPLAAFAWRGPDPAHARGLAARLGAERLAGRVAALVAPAAETAPKPESPG